jgi:predicted secreted protein
VRRRLLAGLLALAFLAGCNDGDGSGLVFKDPKGSIDVEQGMTFSLEFRVNAGVGFDWEPVAAPPGQAALLKLEDTVVDYPDEDRAGDSGTKRFVYRAERSGRQTLVFRKLYRGDAQERRAVNVQIRGG